MTLSRILYYLTKREDYLSYIIYNFTAVSSVSWLYRVVIQSPSMFSL